MDLNLSISFRQVKEDKKWKFELKDYQRRVIEDLILKRNVLAVFPTGYGKSLMFTTTPLIHDRVCSICIKLKLLWYLYSGSRNLCLVSSAQPVYPQSRWSKVDIHVIHLHSLESGTELIVGSVVASPSCRPNEVDFTLYMGYK